MIRNVQRRLALGLTHGWLSEPERAALPATAGWRRRRMLELVRVFEVRPPKGEGKRATFVIQIYKDLARPKRFFPIVFRRAPYALKRSHSKRYFQGEVETIDPAFPPDVLARTGADAVFRSVLKRIQSLEA